MWNLILGVTFFGFLGSSLAEILVNSRGCSIAGVFLIEGESRHSLNYERAKEACEQLGAEMASPEEVHEAFKRKMQTCRNGWMLNETVAILRHVAHGNCAKNQTGFILNSHVTADQPFDAYCFNATAGLEKDCSQAFSRSESPSEPGELSTVPDNETPASEESDYESTTAAQMDKVTDPTVALGDMDLYDLHTTVHPESTEVIPKENVTLNSETGSGMLPTAAEDAGETFTTAHVEEREELLPGLGGRDEDESQSEVKGDTTEMVPPPPGKGRSVLDDGPKRDSQENGGPSNWLVIVGVLVAVAAILLVCAVVAKRNALCGKQQTLMITSKDVGEGNEAAMSASSSHAQEREQEMVTLMNKEKIQENGNTEEFTVITLEESPDKDQTA
ncbi:CD44 antigen [Eucyclogobius newberryi]|uniref:CD44 antigen n=1 Tax=Eucyclogobius newberryi TaxID=166745 RepID=UPI003B59A21E